MKRLALPNPPNPDDQMYASNPLAYNRAVYTWMQQSKGLIEQASRVNDVPAGQAIIAENYTTNTVLSGTSSGTDLANGVCSLIDTLTQKGILAPRSKRSNS
jgi:hypothetical protein